MIDFPDAVPAPRHTSRPGGAARKAPAPDLIRELVTRELLAIFSFVHRA